jgi:hypothetical protein
VARWIQRLAGPARPAGPGSSGRNRTSPPPDPRHSPHRRGPSARRAARPPSGRRSSRRRWPPPPARWPRRCGGSGPGSRAAPRPILCGKIVAPTTLLWPCTASMPKMIGISWWPPAFPAPRRGRRGSTRPSAGRGAVVAVRRAVAAGQDRAQAVLAQLVRRDRGAVGLDGLGDLLLDGHLAHQLGDEGLGLGVGDRRRAGRLGPERRMGVGGVWRTGPGACFPVRRPSKGPGRRRGERRGHGRSRGASGWRSDEVSRKTLGAALARVAAPSEEKSGSGPLGGE